MFDLTGKQALFVDEYLIDLNATQAAIRAGYSARTANEQGCRLLANVSVQAALQERMQKRAQKTEITQEKVLERLWMIATADPNELVEYRRECCRHCFGELHMYQWIDEEELAIAIAEASDPDSVSQDGGFGYDSSIAPHPKCPKCAGNGKGRVHVHDSRQLSQSAGTLYAGVKVGKDGLEVKMHDQLAALDKVARHLGMFKDKLDLTIDIHDGLADRMARARERATKSQS
ncbi:terminase small subunit [Pseudomonas sp. GB2N2]